MRKKPQVREKRAWHVQGQGKGKEKDNDNDKHQDKNKCKDKYKGTEKKGTMNKHIHDRIPTATV
jgi:hypothetical protein